MSKRPALQCLWLQCGSPQSVLRVIDISLTSQSISPKGVGVLLPKKALLFVLSALCGLHEVDMVKLHEVDIAKHVRPDCRRHSCTGNL